MDLQVPPVTMKAGPKAPFQVVGLQQAWREDGLALYACLMPADGASAQSSTKTQKIKVSSSIYTCQSCTTAIGSSHWFL